MTLRDVPYGQTLAMRPIARAAGPLFALDDALLLPSPARSPRWRPIRIESLLQQRCHALTQSNRPPGEQTCIPARGACRLAHRTDFAVLQA